MLQRSRNVLEVTRRKCYNVSGTSCKLLDEDVTTYQERLESYLKKMSQRIKSVLKVTWQKMSQRSRHVLEVTRRKCYNISGTSCKLLEENVTTYQERLESYLKNMLQRIKSVLEVTWRKCYNVSKWKLVAMLQRLGNANERTLLRGAVTKKNPLKNGCSSCRWDYLH